MRVSIKDMNFARGGIALKAVALGTVSGGSLRQLSSARFLFPRKAGLVLPSSYFSKYRVAAVKTNPCVRSVTTGVAVDSKELPHDHTRVFAIERILAAGLVPLFPAALFIHNGMMDFVLATAVCLHFHWGFETIVVDYARPILLGDTAAKLAKYGAYAVSVLLYASLLYFNYNDVGITKAFELMWSL